MDIIVIGTDTHKDSQTFAAVRGATRRVLGDRLLDERGERIVRVPPKRMAGARDNGRERRTSDCIDATCAIDALQAQLVPLVALRFLQPHLARRIWQLLRGPRIPCQASPPTWPTP